MVGRGRLSRFARRIRSRSLEACSQATILVPQAYEPTCNELKIANRYWKASVSLLNVNIPNSHVIPNKGNNTTADWTPDLPREKYVLITLGCEGTVFFTN